MGSRRHIAHEGMRREGRPRKHRSQEESLSRKNITQTEPQELSFSLNLLGWSPAPEPSQVLPQVRMESWENTGFRGHHRVERTWTVASLLSLVTGLLWTLPMRSGQPLWQAKGGQCGHSHRIPRQHAAKDSNDKGLQRLPQCLGTAKEKWKRVISHPLSGQQGSTFLLRFWVFWVLRSHEYVQVETNLSLES